MIDTVLFDVGGTLITQTHTPERTISYARYIITRLAEHGMKLPLSPEELVPYMRGRVESYKVWALENGHELEPLRIWNEFVFGEFAFGEEKLSPIAEEFSFCYDYIRLDNRPREGLAFTLQALKDMGMKIGIITNTFSGTFADHILKENGVLDYFPVIVKSCESGYRKPDARLFQLALDRIGSKKETTCYVGDTISRDVIGSRNAGLALCIKIDNPSISYRDAVYQKQGSPRADFEIQRLDEIPDLIGKLNRIGS